MGTWRGDERPTAMSVHSQPGDCKALTCRSPRAGWVLRDTSKGFGQKRKNRCDATINRGEAAGGGGRTPRTPPAREPFARRRPSGGVRPSLQLLSLHTGTHPRPQLTHQRSLVLAQSGWEASASPSCGPRAHKQAWHTAGTQLYWLSE